MTRYQGLNQEISRVQNPGLGAFLLWRFVATHCDSHSTGNAPDLLRTFLVLPLVLRRGTLENINGTLKKSGLRKFAAKLSSVTERKSDILFGVHNSALQYRRLTYESMQLACACGLLHLDCDTASLMVGPAQIAKSSFPDGIKELTKGAEKLGHWFSALGHHEISSILKVEF